MIAFQILLNLQDIQLCGVQPHLWIFQGN
uniref:Uncharacterized protein n=1 Tax=Anguilla anguilla TaxID=7936 RepID=A0A0E9UC71_ANGAN